MQGQIIKKDVVYFQKYCIKSHIQSELQVFYKITEDYRHKAKGVGCRL
jgi:hypothetical protein